LGIYYLLLFWDIEYACQPNVSEMFGEHYDHSLPHVELWSIWKKSCNQPIWAQNRTNSVWLGIFQLNQNPWRIRRSCNYKSCSKLHPLSPQFSRIFSHPLAIFPVHNSILVVIFELENNCSIADLSVALRLTPGPPAVPSSQMAATRCGIALRTRDKMVGRHRAKPL
jgi:hypothetical protein